MRFVLISDTHMAHDKLVVPDGDVIIHAGDATWKGRLPEIGAFANWYASLPHRVKIFVPGNHDLLFDGTSAELAKSLLPGGITFLNDDLTYVEDIAIYGSPWTPKFGYGWAFNAPRGPEIARHWAKIPSFTNVLITHGPPMGILDSVPKRRADGLVDLYDVLHVGCEELRAVVDSLSDLKLHVFGHIHESGGVSGKFVNASMMNMDYSSVRAPIVFEI